LKLIASQSTLIKDTDFETLAWEYFLKAKRDGVMHAEIFFDPQAHVERGVAYSTVVHGLTAACKKAQTELGITVELIPCILRHLPLSSAWEMYKQALPDLQSGTVAGLGLSSTELGNRPGQFKEIYADAEAKGIRRTAHAGEEGDVSYMREALEVIHVQRVDHGIKLADDPELMAEFARKKILITVCPLSNVELRCVKSVKELPLRTFLDNGVQFSINSDDPSYLGGYILANYCAVQEAFNFSVEDWATIVIASIERSWCSENRKDDMLKLLDKYVKAFA
jgi:adenosine deaminase